MTVLADLADRVDYGVTESASDDPDGRKFLRITDIQDDQVDWESVPYCPRDAKGAVDSELERGDIVFARTGATTGKSFLIDEPPDGAVFASYLIRVRLKDDVEPRYVAHFFRSPDYWRQITTHSEGVAQPGVNATKLKKLEIPLPPIEEQRRIAAVLDAADELRTKRRQALAKLDTLTQAIFIDMFGDPREWSGGQQLGEFVDLYSGSTLPEGEEFDRQKDGFALVKVSDLARTGNDKLLHHTAQWAASGGPVASTCPRYSIVIPKRGGAIGTNRKRITTRRSVLDPNLMGIYPSSDSLELGYLYGWFDLLDLETIQSGSSVPQLNKKDLVPLRIKIPELAEQRRFGQSIQTLNRYRSSLDSALDKLDTLFASLQQRAFAGEL